GVRRQGGPAQLHGERVVRGDRGGLGGGDVQPERQRVAAAPRRNGDRLGQRVGGGGAGAVQPGVPRPGVGGLGRAALAGPARGCSTAGAGQRRPTTRCYGTGGGGGRVSAGGCRNGRRG